MQQLYCTSILCLFRGLAVGLLQSYSVLSVKMQKRNTQKAEGAGAFQHRKEKDLGEASLQPSCV